jgi:hypothetical protein
VAGCVRVRRRPPPVQLKTTAVTLGRSVPESGAAAGRGNGARRRAPLPLPVFSLFSPPARPSQDASAASRLKSGIFPGPCAPAHPNLTQPFQSNCLSIIDYLLPNGESFIFSKGNSGKTFSLIRRDLPSGTEMELFRGMRPWPLAPSPDGQYIAFISRIPSGKVMVVGTSGGTPRALYEGSSS